MCIRDSTIYGNAPTLALAQRVLAAFELEEYQAAVRWEAVVGGQEIALQGAGFRLFTADTVHSRPCLALRFEEPDAGRAIVYSADTEPCDAVRELARGAAVLIHEATTPEPFPGHTTPRQAGEVAAAAGASELVLVHFSPRWTMSAAQAIDEVRAGGFGGEATIGREFGSYSL